MAVRNESKNTVRLMTILIGLAIISVLAGLILAVPYIEDLRANQALKKEVAFLRPEADPSGSFQVQLPVDQSIDGLSTLTGRPDDSVLPDSNMQAEPDATANGDTFATNDLLALLYCRKQ